MKDGAGARARDRGEEKAGVQRGEMSSTGLKGPGPELNEVKDGAGPDRG